MADQKTGGTMKGANDSSRVLRISATDINGSTGNDRLSAKAGYVRLRAYERTVICTTETNSGAITIYLPPAMEMIGETVTIIAEAIANAGNITVKSAGGIDVLGVNLTATNDVVCLLSCGQGSGTALHVFDGWVTLHDLTT